MAARHDTAHHISSVSVHEHRLPPHTAADATDAACSWQGRLSSSNLDSGTADTVAAMVRGLPVAQNEKQDGGGGARSKSE